MLKKKIPKGCYIKDGKVYCPRKRSKAFSRNKSVSSSSHRTTKVSAVC